MRFGFVTCVQLGLSCMEAIYEVGGMLNLAVTLEDGQAIDKSGRAYLDDFCAHRDIPLLKARNVNRAEVVEAVRTAGIDWLFIVGWSQIARGELLSAPTRGVLGMHPTLLPIGRGRASIPWAILKQLDRTGVTLFKLDEGVDTGDILDQVVIPLTARTNATELYAAVEAAHGTLMKAAFPHLLSNTITPRPQDEGAATEWPGRRPEDGEIDLAGSVAAADRLVRAVTRPYPGAFVIERGRKMIVWEAEIVSQEADIRDGHPVLNFRDGCLRIADSEYVAAD